MDYPEAAQRLANHTNLPGTGRAIEHSFLGCLWLSDRKGRVLDWAGHVEDIIRCLRVANTFFNGAHPDERHGLADHSQISDLAYSVSGIISAGLQYHLKWVRASQFDPGKLDSLELSICRIAYAWDQVLASDISDILEGFDGAKLWKKQ